MNRTDRLYAIAEHLRRTGTTGVSTSNLASLLEVSTRTVKRDISALQQAGLPIWAQTGPGGGYFLADSATLPPVNFTASQAVAVSIALAVLPSGSPFSTDGEAAARKVRDALGPRANEDARVLGARVWIERPDTAPRRATPATLRAVERSLAERRVLAIRYVDGRGEVSRRTVEPAVVAWRDNRWFLVAHCRTRNDIRWFRLDRIEQADLTKTEFTPRPTADIGNPPAAAHSMEAAWHELTPSPRVRSGDGRSRC